MKKLTKLLLASVSAAALGFGIAGCSDGSSSNNSSMMMMMMQQQQQQAAAAASTADLASLAVGSTTKLNGVEYYVIANKLGAASRTLSEVDADSRVSANYDAEIRKFASDVYVSKLLDEIGITKYIELWNPNQHDDNSSSNGFEVSSNGTVSYRDRFIIANAKGVKLATFQQVWDSDSLMKNLIERNQPAASGLTTSSTKEERGNAFKKISDYDMRTKYEPNKFKIVPDAAHYGEAKNRSDIEKIYNYDKNGQVALTDANLKSVGKTLDGHNTKYGVHTSFNYRIFNETEDDDGVVCKQNGYELMRPSTGNSIFNLYEYNYSNTARRFNFSARGDGTQNGSTDMDDYCDRIDVRLTKKSDNTDQFINLSSLTSGKTATYRNIGLSVTTFDKSKSFADQEVWVGIREKETDSSMVSQYKDDSLKTKYTMKEAIAKFFSDRVYLSDKETTINGYIVPSEIVMRTMFAKADADFNKDFLIVTLVPVANGDSVTFKLKEAADKVCGETVPTFVKTYSDAFENVAEGTYKNVSEFPQLESITLTITEGTTKILDGKVVSLVEFGIYNEQYSDLLYKRDVKVNGAAYTGGNIKAGDKVEVVLTKKEFKSYDMTALTKAELKSILTDTDTDTGATNRYSIKGSTTPVVLSNGASLYAESDSRVSVRFNENISEYKTVDEVINNATIRGIYERSCPDSESAFTNLKGYISIPTVAGKKYTYRLFGRVGVTDAELCGKDNKLVGATTSLKGIVTILSDGTTALSTNEVELNKGLNPNGHFAATGTSDIPLTGTFTATGSSVKIILNRNGAQKKNGDTFGSTGNLEIAKVELIVEE